MILYLDASALVKRYVEEEGSEAVAAWLQESETPATALITRVEVAAALAKAVRMKVLNEKGSKAALAAFVEDWPNLVRVPLTEGLAARAASLAVRHGLRGYDAVHLASALLLGELVNEEVCFAAYDERLRQAARDEGLVCLPAGPEGFFV